MDTSTWVMSHIWMSHVTHMNESCSPSHVSIHTCDMTYSRVTWLIHMWHDPLKRPSSSKCQVAWGNKPTLLLLSLPLPRPFPLLPPVLYAWHDSFMCVPWLLHMWQDYILAALAPARTLAAAAPAAAMSSFSCSTWMIHVCDITHQYVIYDTTPSYVTWILNMWHESSHVWWGGCGGYQGITYRLIKVCDIDVTHMDESHTWMRQCHTHRRAYQGITYRHDSFICDVALHITYRHDSFICDLDTRHIWTPPTDRWYSYVTGITSLMNDPFVTGITYRHDSFICDGTPQYVTCIDTNHSHMTCILNTWCRSLLQKSPMKENLFRKRDIDTTHSYVTCILNS